MAQNRNSTVAETRGRSRRRRRDVEAVHPADAPNEDPLVLQERFARLARLFDREPHGLSVHEIDCGRADFAEYLGIHRPHAVYSGSDPRPEMITAARERFPEATLLARQIRREVPEDVYDFVVWRDCGAAWTASRRQVRERAMRETLTSMYAMATKGLAVCVPALATSQPWREFEPSPEVSSDQPLELGIEALLAFVVGRLSRHVELDAAGPIPEYILRVYRPEYVKAAYRQPAFGQFFEDPVKVETVKHAA